MKRPGKNSALPWFAVTFVLIFVVVVFIRPADMIPGCGSSTDSDPTPPNFPLMPLVERVALNQFQLSWEEVSDDVTPSDRIRYEIGVVEAPYCVVDDPEAVVVGETQTSLILPSGGEFPLVGFTVRALDEEGSSFGYGRCGWALRAPNRNPIELAGRAPAFQPSDWRDACTSDGSGGAWCGAGRQLAHFGSRRWQVFPVFTDTTVEDWISVGPTEALARVAGVQIQLSLANGIHAYLISPSSQPFDGWRGTIRTGLERAYVGVRGMVGEFTSGHVDLAGPASALRLPQTCDSVVSMGDRAGVAFALCATQTGHVVYRGEAERRLMNWEEPISVEGDAIAGISGTLDNGVLVATAGNGTATAYLWQNREEVSELQFEARSAERVEVAVSGNGSSPFLLLRHGDSVSAYTSSEGLELLPIEGDSFMWRGTPVPMDSGLVGTTNGILALSHAGVVRIGRISAEQAAEHPTSMSGHRAPDSRFYVMMGPSLDALFSTLGGTGFSQHAWRGSNIEPFDMAVSPSGSMYVSGWIEADEGRRATIVKLGSRPEIGLSLHPEFREPPHLAIDDLGRLYATDGISLSWFSGATGLWEAIEDQSPGHTGLVGLPGGALLLSDAPAVCTSAGCEPRSWPFGDGAQPDAVWRSGDGVCGSSGLELWCGWGREEVSLSLTDSFVGDFAREVANQSPTIRDAVRYDGDGWLLALQHSDSGVIATLSDEGVFHLLGKGFEWADGNVLALATGRQTVTVLEKDGPTQVRLHGERVSIPGRLY